MSVKDLVWLGTTRKDVRGFPRRVQRGIGYTLFLAQYGDKHPDAKPLRGFGGAGVVEMVEHFDGATYRAVYTVKFEKCGLCAPRLSEEVDRWDRDRPAGHRPRSDEASPGAG